MRRITLLFWIMLTVAMLTLSTTTFTGSSIHTNARLPLATNNSNNFTSPTNLLPPIINGSVTGAFGVSLGALVNVSANTQANLNVDSGTMYITVTSDHPIQISFKSHTTSSASFPAGHTHVGNYIEITTNDTAAHVTVAIAMSYANIASSLNATIQARLKLYYAEASDTVFTQASNSVAVTSKTMVNVTVNHFSTWTLGYGPTSTSTPAAPILISFVALPILALYKKRKH